MNFAKKIAHHAGGAGTIAVAAGLLATIYLAPERLQWVTFLAGILTAAVLAIVVRTSRAEWMVARRSRQLTALRAKLAVETTRRSRADDALAAAAASSLHLLDSIPAMIAYVDAGRVIRFHNASFREWIGSKRDAVHDRTLHEVLGTPAYGAIVERIDGALDGGMTTGESVHTTAKGECCRLAAQYLPHFGKDGRVLGAYAIMTEVTARSDVLAAPQPASVEEGASRALYVSSIAQELTGWKNVGDRLRECLDCDEFSLYCQSIVPAKSVAVAAPFFEILVRLDEEERNLMPPGAFLQLAEEHGLLPLLDRWVVSHLMDWAEGDRARQAATYSVNVSAQTLLDEGFLAFVAQQLRSRDLRNFTLCFEFSELAATQHPAEAARFVRRARREGCRLALSGFGRSLDSFDLLKSVPVDYLKIDSGIILGMLRGTVEHAKVKAINRVAHAAGMATIAECVENDETFAALRALEVDYAQGFGIERPTPLAGLSPKPLRRLERDASPIPAAPPALVLH